MRKPGVILLVGALLVGLIWAVLFVWAASYRHDPLTPAEHVVADTYDSVFAGTSLSLQPVGWTHGAVQRTDQHLIYRVIFDSQPYVTDFKQMSLDSLRGVADAVYRDLLPAIPKPERYDSL